MDSCIFGLYATCHVQDICAFTSTATPASVAVVSPASVQGKEGSVGSPQDGSTSPSEALALNVGDGVRVDDQSVLKADQCFDSPM